MPKKESKVVCPHDERLMHTTDGFHAFTEVTRPGDIMHFNPASGIPVKVYVCPQCGYIETFHAHSDPEWSSKIESTSKIESK